jgi:hypothetical protein
MDRSLLASAQSWQLNSLVWYCVSICGVECSFEGAPDTGAMGVRLLGGGDGAHLTNRELSRRKMGSGDSDTDGDWCRGLFPSLLLHSCSEGSSLILCAKHFKTCTHEALRVSFSPVWPHNVKDAQDPVPADDCFSVAEVFDSCLLSAVPSRSKCVARFNRRFIVRCSM